MSILDTLTKRQRSVYNFIRDKIHKRGYGPTVREIGEKFDIASPNGVMCHLRALEKKGLIIREPNMSRAIQLAPEAEQAEAGLPLAGQVAAGVMHQAIEQEDRIDIGKLFAKKSQFVLKVTGDSMIDAHIDDGDYVVVTKKRTASPGDLVVVQIEDGETAVRYWHPEKSRKRIRLQPANSKMEPTYVKDAKVIGIVSGVVRSLR